ncbi:MAG: cell division protein FtsL [Pseudomonadales bacterium]|nr:cell division protein FtsL [Pseudomonadales bacterium]
MAESSAISDNTVSSQRSWFLVATIALLVVLSAISVIYSTYSTRKLVAEFQQLQNMRNDMEVEWGQLLLEQSTWGSFNRVERLASKRLKMIVPEPNKIVMVSQ